MKHPLIAVLCCAVLGAGPALAQDASRAPHRTFGVACDRCHTATSWHDIRKDAAFDHAQTGFALEGAHAAVACAQCHKGKGFEGMDQGCGACHADPHHAEFGDACRSCHNQHAWRTPARAIALHESTRFPLLGAHRLADCATCHVNQQKNEYSAIPVECVACHRSAYEHAQAPDHRAVMFPTACEQCHRVEQPSWHPASFDHAGFPLIGRHRATACAACHPGGRYAGTPTDCDACHHSAYLETTNPAHAASSIPTDCARCHTPAGWNPASFDHTATGFPLTGAHQTTPCNACHVNGRWTGLPTDCFSCHGADFNTTTNPNHRTNNFPTTCATCHSTASWRPSTFDHDAQWFRIYSGKHRNAWTRCDQCHTTPGNFAAFSCIDCHEHNKAEMDNEHRGRAGYVYASVECLRCHPRD